jgi:uncharacterized protein
MRKLASIVVLLAAALLPGEARAIDCAAATDAITKGICAVPALTEKEDAMEGLLAEISKLSSEGERAMLEKIQNSWIEERSDNCGDLDAESIAECLNEGLDERIAEFKVTPESGTGASSRMIPVYVTQVGDDTHYSVYAQAFRFAEPKSDGEKLFNAHVADILAKLPLAAQPSETEGEVRESDTSMAIKFASPKLLSAAAYWWHDNDEDGVGGLATFNINMETGKDIVISDVVSEQAAGELRKMCRERLIEQKKEQVDELYKPEDDPALKDEVIAEHVANLSRWTITAEEVSILFDTGAIGDAEEGDYECLFSLADVKKLALPGAPLP